MPDIKSIADKADVIINGYAFTRKDDYQLSAEVIAMVPAKRKSIYGDYDAELVDVLEEKYR